MPGPTASTESLTKLVGVRMAEGDYEDLRWYADKVVGKKAATVVREVGAVIALRLAKAARRKVATPVQRTQEQVRYLRLREKLMELV